MKVYEIDHHPAAADDLFRIFNLIESYAGTAIAHHKLGEIERVTRGLSDFPYIYRPVMTFKPDSVPFLPEKRRSSASSSTKIRKLL
jgi:plasmid stabilization system protein ParE